MKHFPKLIKKMILSESIKFTSFQLIFFMFAIFLICASTKLEAQSVRYEVIANFEGASIRAIGQAIISSDGGSIAIAERSATGEFVSINGMPQKAFNKIIKNTMSWSNDGKSLVYVGERLGEQYIVNDQKEIKLTGRIKPTGFYQNPVFSFDGSRLMWITTEKEGMSVFLDNSLVSFEQHVGYASFIPFTSEIFFIARKNCRFQVIDTRKFVHPIFELINFPIISSTNSNYWYTAQTIEKNVLVNQLGEIIAENETALNNSSISPDGKRIGYFSDEATEGGGKLVVKITGQPDYELLDIFGGNSSRILFSPDSQNVLFTVPDKEGDNSGFRVVLNNNKSKLWRDVSQDSLLWSLDSSHYAYIVRKDDEKFYVISDSIESIGHESIDGSSLNFSSNGIHLAYIAKIKSDDKKSVFINDKVIKNFDEVTILKLLPNGDPILSATLNGKKVIGIGEKLIQIDADQFYEKTFKILTSNSLQILIRNKNIFSNAIITW